MLPGVAPEHEPERHAGDERGDEARSAERARGPVGERRAGGRDHLPPRIGDQLAAAGVDDDRRDHEPADDTAEHPVADLLEQQRGGTAAIGDLRFHVGRRDGREQQRDADAVVEPALHVESLADPPRDARLGHDRLPERGIGRRQDHGQDDGFLDGQLTEDPSRRERAERDGQRQPDRRADAPAPPTSRRRCPRSIRDASQNSTSASVASASVRTVALELSRSIPSSTSGPTSSPTATNTIAGVTGVPVSRRETAATPSSVERHDCEGPLHRWSPFRRAKSVARVTRPDTYATGSVSTNATPPISSASAMPRTAIRNGRQSSRSEMPAKNSTAAKKTVERMYLSS